MRYCITCLQPDTRPNTVFNSYGLCPACVYSASLADVDWEGRFNLLTQELLPRFKRNNNQEQGFDCIIGVSGGKDSTRQALFVRDKLGLKPLLVCLAYPPEQLSIRGAKNISNLINLGFDVHIISPSPVTWKALKKEGFRRFVNSFRSTEAALFASVPRTAIQYGISLIFWGENPGLQVGDSNANAKEGFDGNALRYVNTLSSGTQWMKDCGFNEDKLTPYTYPSLDQFEEHKIQIIYLGWFWKDWSNVNNAFISGNFGLTKRTDGIEQNGDLYGITALDEDFTPVNQLIKYYKFGFGRITDYVNEEIRQNKLTRDEGINIVEMYDDKIGASYIKNYCKYLDISDDQFWNIIKKSINKSLFEINAKGEIIKKFRVGIGL